MVALRYAAVFAGLLLIGVPLTDSRSRDREDVTSGSQEADVKVDASTAESSTVNENGGNKKHLSSTEHGLDSANDEDPQTPSTTASPCPNCPKIEHERQLRVEMFKQHLLKSLHLSSPPNISGESPKLPFDFYLGEEFSVNDNKEEELDDEISSTTRQIFVFGSDVTQLCRKKRSTGCYSFNLTGEKIDTRDVESVDLWIYKQANPNDPFINTFMVSELGEHYKDGQTTLRIRGVVKRLETPLKHGWMKIFVRKTVTRWLTKPQRNHGLSIVCKTCQRRSHKAIFGEKEGHRPILVFRMNPNRRQLRRMRRQTDCVEGGNNCCHKESLEINFQEIGWNYIMMPATIRADFCTGSCNGINAAFYNHTKMLKKLENSPYNVHGSLIQPCCSPVAWRQSQSLIYRDNTDVVRKVDVPKLIVKSCGCT